MLLFLWICLGFAGIAMFTGSAVLSVLVGISGLISGVIGGYASFADVYNAASRRDVVPIGESQAVRERIADEEHDRIRRLHAADNEPHRAMSA